MATLAVELAPTRKSAEARHRRVVFPFYLASRATLSLQSDTGLSPTCRRNGVLADLQAATRKDEAKYDPPIPWQDRTQIPFSGVYTVRFRHRYAWTGGAGAAHDRIFLWVPVSTVERMARRKPSTLRALPG